MNLKKTFSKFKKIAESSGDKVKDFANNASEKVKDFAGNTGSKAKKFAIHAGNKVKELAGNVGNKAEKLAVNAGNKVIELAGNAGNKVIELADNAGNKAKELADNAGDKMKKLTVSIGIPIDKLEFAYPQRGDVIFAVRGKKLLGGKITLSNLYFHYGVCVGKNKVIHFNDPNSEHHSKSNARIIKTSLKDFVKGDTVIIEPVDETTPHNSNEKTAQKAESMLNCPRNYNLVINNCEHFANECRYNRKKSSQVSKAIKIVLPAILQVIPLSPFVKIPMSLIAYVMSNKEKTYHLKQINYTHLRKH